MSRESGLEASQAVPPDLCHYWSQQTRLGKCWGWGEVTTERYELLGFGAGLSMTAISQVQLTTLYGDWHEKYFTCVFLTGITGGFLGSFPHQADAWETSGFRGGRAPSPARLWPQPLHALASKQGFPAELTPGVWLDGSVAACEAEARDPGPKTGLLHLLHPPHRALLASS